MTPEYFIFIWIDPTPHSFEKETQEEMMDNEKDISYQGYQEMIADINTALTRTGEVLEQLELTDQAQQAEEAARRLKSHVFTVGIMGEFKRGKSTVINALLGQKIAPADVLPASATLNRITYGLTPRATIVFKDGRRQEVPVDSIKEYVTKITDESAAMAQTVELAIVEYPCPFCQNNVEIIDTPGLNDDERMDEISESVIPELDAVVMVLSAIAPFSKSEAEFVRNKLMTSDVSRLIVVVNQIDMVLDEEDRARVVDSIKERIQREVLGRIAAIHGEDSPFYRDARKKLSDMKLYPTSAIRALMGRVRNKPEMVEDSGILPFEDRLRRMLTQERGSLEIVRVSGVISKLLQEGRSALELRANALQMDSEQFKARQREAEAEVVAMRAKKVEEQKQLREKSKQINIQMEQLVLEKYADLEQRLGRFVDSYPLSGAAVESKGFPEQVSRALQDETKQALSDYAEQINVYLREQMGDATLRLSEYMGELSNSVLEINSKLSVGSPLIDSAVVGVDALSNVVAGICTGLLSGAGVGLMGLGGMIEGYRANGIKGAIVGAGGGFAASYATAMALFSLMGGAVAVVPFALFTGVAGTMGGKLLTSLIWKKDKQARMEAKFRSELKEEAMNTVSVLRKQHILENWAQKQVAAQVDELVSRFEQETESLLTSTEKTLNSIAAEMAGEEKKKDQKLETYSQLMKKLEDVSRTVTPILEMATASAKETA